MWLTGSSAGLPLNPNTPTANVYNGNNQRTDLGATAYDAAGNLQMLQPLPSPGLTYDAENRQITAGAYSYGYDGDGRRVTKTGGGLTELYVYDAMGALTAEYDSGTAAAGPCATCYLSYDHLGSVRLVTDANAKVIAKHDYLPFGEEIPASTAGRDATWGTFNDNVSERFTAKERDQESGLDYFGARYYGSALGRFTSPDWTAKQEPVPYADLYDPQTLNLYAYGRNNPLKNSDLDGHNWVTRFGNCFKYGLCKEGQDLENSLQDQADDIRFKLGGQDLTLANGQKVNVNYLSKLSNTQVIDLADEIASQALDDAMNAVGLVNLVRPDRATHILDGDKAGGGHRSGTGKPNKSEFPSNWDDAKIKHEISDVATDPAAHREVQGKDTVVEGTRDGVDIRVIVRNGEIHAAYPTNLPRNPPK